MGPLNRHEITHSVSIRHGILEAHQISSRAQRNRNHGESVRLIQSSDRRSWCEKKREHSLTFLGLIPVPPQKKAGGWSDVQNPPKMCSSLYAETQRRSKTELDDNDGDAVHTLVRGHKFLEQFSPPPLAHPRRCASAEANFPSAQLWITAPFSCFALARWVA